MLVIILVSALLYILWGISKPNKKLTQFFIYIAWVLHAIICFYNLIDEHGWKLNIMNAVLLASWLSALVVMSFKIDSSWVKIPLVFFIVISLIMVDTNSVLDHHHHHEFSWQLNLHIMLSMLAYAVLSVATLYSVSLWVHIKKLKNSNFDSDISLSSLIDEEKKIFYLVSLGWLILSTSLLSGVIFIDNFIEQQIGHKVVFSLLAWLIFGSLIIGRLTRGWRGEKLISLTITGMTMLAIGYLGSKIVLEWIIH
ncbi:MAG: inner membrane protein YpjD [Marinicellaceae bacterium]